MASIQWMCTYCGAKINKSSMSGRPMPGNCRRRGLNLPHRWVKNRIF